MKLSEKAKHVSEPTQIWHRWWNYQSRIWKQWCICSGLLKEKQINTQIGNIKREIKILWKHEQEMLGTTNAAIEIKMPLMGFRGNSIQTEKESEAGT